MLGFGGSTPPLSTKTLNKQYKDMKELIKIQSELKAPKNLYNKFGGYAYRSAESILEAVKPLCAANNCTLTLTDSIELVGSRYYIKATARLTNENGEIHEVSAFAREEDNKKGMDAAQITGSASSYARKYALNGLFCIDDVRDPDTMDNSDKPENKTESKPKPKRAENRPIPAGDDLNTRIKEAIYAIEKANTTVELNAVWKGLDNELKAVELIKNSIIKIRREKGI